MPNLLSSHFRRAKSINVLFNKANVDVHTKKCDYIRYLFNAHVTILLCNHINFCFMKLFAWFLMILQDYWMNIG